MSDERPGVGVSDTPTTADDLLDRVRKAWAEVLDVDTVPLDVSFFEVGGSSLLLLLLWEELTGMTDRTLRAADLFQHSTVRAQAKFLAGAETELAVIGAQARTQLIGRARRGGTTGE